MVDKLDLWKKHEISDLHLNNLENFEKKREKKLADKKPSKSSYQKNSHNKLNKINSNQTKNLFSAYEDIEEDEQSEDNEYNDPSKLTEQRRQRIRNNISQIIKENFDQDTIVDNSKKALINSIPKDFFDDPSKNVNYLAIQKELEEEAGKNKKEKIVEDRKNKFFSLNDKNRNEKDNKNLDESYEGDADEELNEEISAMIEYSKFLGNLSKAEKNKKPVHFNFIDEEKTLYDINLSDNNLLQRKRKSQNDKFPKDNQNGNKSPQSEFDEKAKQTENSSYSIDMDEIINTDFRDIN